MEDMIIVDPILSPEAARRKVSTASPSGLDFMPLDAPAEYFNTLTLLKSFFLIHRSCSVF